MADDIVQIIENARVDATSLSEFMYYPASVTVNRRLAPPIHTLNYYLLYLEGLEKVYSQPTGTVEVNGEVVKTVRQSVNDAIDSAILGDYQTTLEAELVQEVIRATNREDAIEVGLEAEVVRATDAEGLITQGLSNLSLEVDTQKYDTGITATAKFGGVERSQADKNADNITVKDFGLVGDTAANELDGLNAISSVLDIVDLQGKTYYASALPNGTFVNGVIKTPTATYNYGMVSTAKQGVRVGTWNVWSGGSSNTYFNNDKFSFVRFAELKADLVKAGFDIVGMQETHYNKAALPLDRYLITPFVSVATSTAETYMNGDRYGNTTLSDKAIVSQTAVVYASAPDVTDGEKRSYIKTVYQYGDKTVSVYNTHFSLSTPRIAAMATELCDAVLADNSNAVFVMGDFNTADWTLFSRLTSNGFGQVNNKTIDTNPSTGVWYIDEIFYKGATKVGSSSVFIDQRIGDHSALYADFTI